MNNSRMRKFLYVLLHLLVFIVLCSCVSLLWLRDNFGDIGIDEIIFTLSAGVKGTSDELLSSYYKFVIPIMAFFVVFYALLNYVLHKFDLKYFLHFRIKNKNTTIRLKMSQLLVIVLIGSFSLGVYTANEKFGLFNYIKYSSQKSDFIEKNYVNPDGKVVFPDKKRNLIHIFMESGETTVMDKANGGLFDQNYVPELTQIAKDNIAFSQSDLLEGALVTPGSTWTTGGIFSQSNGIPIKRDIGNDALIKKHDFNHYFRTLKSTADILRENGYSNYFMCGSDVSFGGKNSLLTSHGKYKIYDYNTAIKDGLIDKDYFVWWGMEDQKLFEYAKEKIATISKNPGPFNFTMLTVDTHHVDGYKCSLCENRFDKQYANVYACSSKQISNFLNWIREQPFYENTTVVITGDHCSMDPNFFEEVSAKSTENFNDVQLNRKVYNAFINSAIDTQYMKNRKFTTLDFFPTILASVGAEIKGERLGLGTNLFSGKETLSEKYGYKYLYDELKKKSDFYEINLMLMQK
ncbi:hypothetical protein HMPREF1635_06690 [Clostridiales bacterium S5-A14a]|nr:hypothetical protein HMPREF1635_06690 [Clostridiales bacterium S5-A14a]